MSRINAETGEINDVDKSPENDDNESTNANIHSQEKELNDHFPILENVVNRFLTQIILTNNKVKESAIVDEKRKI